MRVIFPDYVQKIPNKSWMHEGNWRKL
jgi:hypothetical protein